MEVLEASSGCLEVLEASCGYLDVSKQTVSI